ncbi:MAG TPA: hypothetical protein VI011_07855 [Asanoa sp.]
MTKGLAVAYAVATGGLGVGILTMPAAAGAWWGLAALLSVTGLARGIWRRRPAVRGPWVLFGAAVVALGAGDVAYANGAAEGGVWPAAAELLYLAVFLPLTVALLQLTSASAVLRDRTMVIDLLTLVCAAGVVGWTVVVGSGALPLPLPAPERWLVATHVLGSVVVVVLTAALLFASRVRNARSLSRPPARSACSSPTPPGPRPRSPAPGMGGAPGSSGACSVMPPGVPRPGRRR